MYDQVIYVVNPYCHQGKGWKRWLQISSEVFSRIALPGKEVVLEAGATWQQQLEELMSPTGNTCLISAGGDGTINGLINYLLNCKPALVERIAVGAVGLGSSNDFLKPLAQKVQQIPVRINLSQPPLWQDVGLIHYKNRMTQNKKYFIVNASLGVTAQANRNFNQPDKLLKFLKKHCTPTAIFYTALKTILQFNNISCTVNYNQQKSVIAMSNINIIKTPFVSGNIHYDQKIEKDDGNLILNICDGMSRWQLVQTLVRLQNGVFPQSVNTSSNVIHKFSLQADSPIIFEYDGETEEAQTLAVKIIPKAIKVLT